MPPLLSLQDIILTFGGDPLINGAELALEKGDRACLVGRNGAGKSTLLKIIAGSVASDSGTRFVQPGTRLAYLPQEPDFGDAKTVKDYVAGGLSAHQEDALHQVEAILDEVKIEPTQNPHALSGGEARRTAIAKLLVSEPDILLMDEPTNHLDLPTIEWLEGKLIQLRSTFVTISHDRTFLSTLTNKCFWIDRGIIRTLNENFAKFEKWSEEILKKEEEDLHKLNREIVRETAWLVKGVTARRKRNQGRLRRLGELREKKRTHIQKTGQANLALESGDASGKLVIEAKTLEKTYDTADGRKNIVRDFSTRILRGDRVGIIGPNGAGKTTLLRLLTGDLVPDKGTCRLGSNLTTAYLDQTRASLDDEKSLWHNLCPKGGDQIDVRGRPRHVVSYLRDFLFDERQARQPVSSLSGGERNRLMLAIALAKPSNLLILDEPTNDLDMDTLDLLEDILADYDGTLLLVSHDRDFLDRLVTSTIAHCGPGDWQEFPGGYSDFQRQKGKGSPAPSSTQSSSPSKAPPKPKKTATNKTKLSYKEQRLLDDLGVRIPQLEKEIAALQGSLSDDSAYAKDPGAFNDKAKRLDAAQAELQECEEKWLEIELLREELQQSKV